MKTPTVSAQTLFTRAVIIASAFAAVVSSSLRASDPQAASNSQKTNILFLGTDLSVKEDDGFYRVVHASKDALQIERDGKIIDVPNSRNAEIRVLHGAKISRLSATIANVKTDSVDREASRAQFEAMRSAMLLDSVAEHAVDLSQANLTHAGLIAIDSEGSPVMAAHASQNQAKALEQFNTALSTSANANALANTFITERLEGSGSVDVDLSFDVSSPEPLENAYIVVVANYGADEKMARRISARAMKRIDEKARRVVVNQPASLAGLLFNKFDVSLFVNGQEIATNLSEKRMELTADQVYQFYLLKYVASHSAATQPPIPMLMLPRMEFRRQMEGAEANRLIFVKVDKSGSVLAMSGDVNGESKLPSSVEVALQNVRFLPALQNGSPTEGTLRFTLAQLAN